MLSFYTPNPFYLNCPVELHEVCTVPPFKAVKVLMDGFSSLQCVDHTTQLGAVIKLAQGELNPTAHLDGKGVNKCQSQ